MSYTQMAVRRSKVCMLGWISLGGWRWTENLVSEIRLTVKARVLLVLVAPCRSLLMTEFLHVHDSPVDGHLRVGHSTSRKRKPPFSNSLYDPKWKHSHSRYVYLLWVCVCWIQAWVASSGWSSPQLGRHHLWRVIQSQFCRITSHLNKKLQSVNGDARPYPEFSTALFAYSTWNGQGQLGCRLWDKEDGTWKIRPSGE